MHFQKGLEGAIHGKKKQFTLLIDQKNAEICSVTSWEPDTGIFEI